MAFKQLKTLVEVQEKNLLGSFQNSNLSNGSLTINHNYATKAVDVVVLNPDGTKLLTDGMQIDTSVSNKVVLNFGGALGAGIFGIIIKFYI
jgi:hypothetical protein